MAAVSRQNDLPTEKLVGREIDDGIMVVAFDRIYLKRLEFSTLPRACELESVFDIIYFNEIPQPVLEKKGRKWWTDGQQSDSLSFPFFSFEKRLMNKEIVLKAVSHL